MDFAILPYNMSALDKSAVVITINGIAIIHPIKIFLNLSFFIIFLSLTKRFPSTKINPIEDMALKGSNSIFFILSKKPKDFLSDNNWIKLVSNNSSIPILFKNCSFQLDVSTLDKLSSMEVIKQNKTHFVKDIFSFCYKDKEYYNNNSKEK